MTFKRRRNLVWKRPRFVPGGGDAQLDFYLFSHAPWPVDEFSEALGECGWETGATLCTTERDAEMVSLLNTGSTRRYLPKETRDELTRVPYCNSFHATIEDPSDLWHLQAAWELVRWSESYETVAVLDGQSLNWFSFTDVCSWSSDAPLNASRELQLIIESDTDDHGRVLAHTRGLGKFGRRDVIIPGLDPSYADAAQFALSRTALMLVEGACLVPPCQLSVGEAPALHVAEYPTFMPGFDSEDGRPPVEGALQLSDRALDGTPRAGLVQLAKWLRATARGE